MFVKMPPDFPQAIFQEFARCSTARLPDLFYDDQIGRRRQFDQSWMAVWYRYRTCWEYKEEFKGLLSDASDQWREWNDGEEQNYKLERSLYGFFMSALSVFDSFAFCLYFLGSAMRPAEFHLASEPKRVTLKETARAFSTAYPGAGITAELAALSEDEGFRKIQDVRNVLAHRLTGRRNIRVDFRKVGSSYTQTRDEVWNLPGSGEGLTFDSEMVEGHMEKVTTTLSQLIESALAFARSA